MSSAVENTLPDGWKWVDNNELIYVTDYVANGSFKSLRDNVTYKDEEDYAILVRLKDFTNNWNGVYKYVDENAFKFLSKSSLQKDDIVMCNVGSVGKYFLVPDLEKPMTLAPNSVLIRPINSGLDNKFLFYYYASKIFSTKLKGILSTTAQPKFNKTGFRALRMPIPPLEEQKCIVAKIDTLFAKIDKAISLTEESSKQAKNLLPSVLKEVFEKGKADGWEEKIFDDLKESNSLGLVRSVKQQSLDYSYDYVKMNNVTNDNKFTFQNITRVNADEKEVQKYKLKKGDFLFNTRNSFELVGKSCVFNDEKNNVLFNNNLMRVRFKNDINSHFILYQFSSPYVKHQLGKIKSGTTNVSAIYYKSLKDVKLLITSTEHQEELVFYFDEVSEYSNQTQSKLEEQLAYLKQLKSSILSKAFQGEL
jgi:type I restriction enzyme, S subunit